MSEKRFTTDYSDFLKNNKTFIKIDNERLTYEEIVNLLNNQQATINKLNKRNEYLKKELNKQIMLLNIVGERLKDD